MKNDWKQLNNFSSKPLSEVFQIIEKVFKMYTDVELKRIESLIKAINTLEK